VCVFSFCHLSQNFAIEHYLELLPSMPGPPKYPLPMRLLKQNFLSISFFKHVCCMILASDPSWVNYVNEAGIAVSIVTDLRLLEFNYLRRQESFFLPWHWDPPNFLSVSTRVSFVREGHKPDHSLPYSTENKYAWSYVSTFPWLHAESRGTILPTC
jgi:hypothetical protein